MSSPPRTPTSPTFHRRRSSNFSSNSHRNSLSRSQTLSQRSSAAYSPANSRLGSSHGHGDSLAAEFAELGGGGMGSLADELGGWGSADEEEGEESILEEDGEGDVFGGELHGEKGGKRRNIERERDSGIEITSSPLPTSTTSQQWQNGRLLPPSTSTTPTKRKGSGHKRVNSAYDGSEYGSESDFEETELVSATLEARLSVVEALARRGIEENGSEGDRVIARVTEGLKDLGGQSGIESGTTRLTTSYTALSTHLTHQTRLLSQLTSSILSPLAPQLPLELIEDLIPAIDATLSHIPSITPPPHPHHALHSLIAHTADLIQTLNYMSDTVHMNRQTTTTAGRRLKVVKEVLREWRIESEGCERSVDWIERGDWGAKLSRRECKGVCDEVLGGFEDVCGEWRERLV
ncbi:hypothetical protein EJ08DRAFT_576751, partial [Tothia fuscella]